LSESHPKIGESLKLQGLVTEDQVSEALAEQKREGGKLVETLIRLGHIDIKSVVNFLARQPGIASVELFNYEIPREVVNLVPRSFAIEHEVFPLDRIGKLLTVGMAFPLDINTVQELEDLTGLRVRRVLCSANDIRVAIDQYYPPDPQRQPVAGEEGEADIARVETGLKLGSAAHLIRQLEHLPPLPDTVEKVRKAVQDPEVSIREVAAIVREDPAIAAKLLSVVNSAAFGFNRTVDSVDLAASLLGLKDTYMIVMSAAVPDLFDKNPDFDYRRFWATAQAAARTATAIAKQRGETRTTGYYSAALLHDIGRLALVEVAPQQYAHVDSSLYGRDLIESEAAQMGLTHTEAGYLLAESWELPPELSEPIRFHHNLDLAAQRRAMVATVQLASTIEATRQLPEEEVRAAIEACSAAVELLDLSVDGVMELTSHHAEHSDIPEIP